MNLKSGDHNLPLVEREEAARDQLDSDIEVGLDILREIILLIDRINRCSSATVTADLGMRMVVTKLMYRLCDEVRCLMLIAERGYGMQAATLAASIYEIAFSSALINLDPRYAATWATHEEPTQPWMKTRKLTDLVWSLANVSDAEERRQIDYKRYRMLCMCKHANPLFQRHSGTKVDEVDRYGGSKLANITFTAGPDQSEGGTSVTLYALDCAVRYSLLAVQQAGRRAQPDQKAALAAEYNAIAERYHRHCKAWEDRWGDPEDPFPGKW